MRKIKLLISYDGTDFQGWQRQPERATVQSALEDVLAKLYKEPVKTIASGRTDAGTHAVGQVVHFKAPKILNGEAKLQRALNGLLPDSITVKGVWLAPEDFHAMASARRKTYIYRVWNHPIRSALWYRSALHVQQKLDLDYLNRLGQMVVENQDFKSFQSTGTPVKSTIRYVDLCEWHKVKGPLLEMRVRSNGFLKQMVRNLVGTMLHLERIKADPSQLAAIFEAKDRRAAWATAPAHGLYLYRVEYPADLDNKCLKL